MSVVRRYSPEEVAAWAERSNGPEPIVVGELPGWERRDHVGSNDRMLPNERLVSLVRGATKVHIMRWWDRPLHPGGPLVIASKRTIRWDGREVESNTTSMFDGVPDRKVEVIFVPAPTWFVRIVFDQASVEDVDEVLAAIRIIA